MKAGYRTIPALIHEIESVQELMEISLIENTQREDLNPIEEAEGYHALVSTCLLKPEEVAKKVGKDRSTITNLIRLLNLPPEIQAYLKSGQLHMGHARALLGLDSEADQLELGHRCVRSKMTVREIENAVKSRRSGRDKIKRLPAREARRDPNITEFEEKLRHHYGTGIKIRTGTKQGRIEIEFYDHDDLGTSAGTAPGLRPLMGGVALLLLAIAGLNACSLIHQEQPNDTPKLQISAVDTTRIGRNARVQFEVRASDEDDDPLFYTWNVYGEGVVTDTVCTLDPLAQVDLGRSGPECARIQWFTPTFIDGHNELFPITVTISDLHTESNDIVESFVIEVFQGSRCCRWSRIRQSPLPSRSSSSRRWGRT